MISIWRRKAARRVTKDRRKGEKAGADIEVVIPNHFRCPISLDLMKDPVTLSTGITYDRENIEKWIEQGNVTCPITNQALKTLEPIPNHSIRVMIQDWCVENKSYGIERIPTPRIPVSSVEVLEFHSKITTACKLGDQARCQNLVTKLKTLTKESDRNKRCIIANGTTNVLAHVFQDFSKSSFSENVAVLEEILSTLSLMFPLTVEAKDHLGSASSMECIVWFLKSGDLSRRRNAVLVLRELVSMDPRKLDLLKRIEGGMEALFNVIKEPTCHTTIKASLVVIYHMISSTSETVNIVKKFVDMGLVSLLLEMVVDNERSICEKALAILDGICSCEEGREKACGHALTIPVLVKKIHRVSDLATEFSVSILWKLCKNEKSEDCGVFLEALQVGAFQKLLLLLQIGCNENTKEKLTELLKLLNLRRQRLECIDSMDFKDLKRQF